MDQMRVWSSFLLYTFWVCGQLVKKRKRDGPGWVWLQLETPSAGKARHFSPRYFHLESQLFLALEYYVTSIMHEKPRNGHGLATPCCKIKVPSPPSPPSRKLLLILTVTFLRWNTHVYSSALCVASEKVSHRPTWQRSLTNRNGFDSLFFWTVVREHKFIIIPHSPWIQETNNCHMARLLSLEMSCPPPFWDPASWICECVWVCISGSVYVIWRESVIQRKEKWQFVQPWSFLTFHCHFSEPRPLLWRQRTPRTGDWRPG